MTTPTIFQDYIHGKLRDTCLPTSNILKRAIVRNLFIRAHIPCTLHKMFLDEMEELGLIRQRDKQNIEILNKEYKV